MKKFKASGEALMARKSTFNALSHTHLGIAIVLLLAMPSEMLQSSAKSSAKASPPISVFGAFTCDLPAPSSFNAERTGSSTASLDWSSVSAAISYHLLVYDLSNQTLISSTVEYGTSKSLTGLNSGVIYRCVIASMCSGASTSSFIIAEDILD